MNAYFISGLAADRDIFKNIRLPETYTHVFLDWIKPIKKETLTEYAIRLAETIDHSKPFVLIGLSLGGMIATEIARQIPPRVLILISSVPVFTQLPPYYGIAGKLKLHTLIPVSFLKSASIIKRLFTAESSSDKQYLRKTIRESDPDFVRWAINAILNWKNRQLPDSYIHIHGSRDHILPLRFARPTHVIKEAGHLMILNRFSEINEIIGETLIHVR